MIYFNTKGNPLSGFYLHGKIEDIMGFDLVSSSDNIPIGITDCLVNNEYHCNCYSWNRSLGQCGLICLQEDKEGNAWAKCKYNNKSEFI